MTDTTAIIVAEEPSTSGVSWPAIIAGAVASLALTLVLLTLGTGLGLAVVSPAWANEAFPAERSTSQAAFSCSSSRQWLQRSAVTSPAVLAPSGRA